VHDRDRRAKLTEVDELPLKRIGDRRETRVERQSSLREAGAQS
jgi:hypothetical protein